eukprot:COSAG01_NODE_4667_length_4834_cov_23.607814_8_plen_62_part_00
MIGLVWTMMIGARERAPPDETWDTSVDELGSPSSSCSRTLFVESERAEDESENLLVSAGTS